MCSKSMNMGNCKNMGCAWSTGKECMTRQSVAEAMLFGGGSAVAEAMDTQINLSTVVLLAAAALALHLLSRCWAERKRFDGYSPPNSTERAERGDFYQTAHSV